jgi:TetR/AcrR family transcriptional regulator, cholesterol catabolism regulator
MSQGPQNLGRPREFILEAATQLFSEKGYAGTTMRDIAKAVGVLPGSLYAHIDGKESLLLEIVEAGIDLFLAAGTSLEGEGTPADRMRAAIKAHIAVVAANPQRTLVVFHQWRFLSGPNRARIVDKRRRYETIFTSLMDEGLAEGTFGKQLDSKIAVLGILGALNWTAEWYSPDGPVPSEVVGDRLADTVLWGLLRSNA